VGQDAQGDFTVLAVIAAGGQGGLEVKRLDVVDASEVMANGNGI
jgi:hypothetical protein